MWSVCIPGEGAAQKSIILVLKPSTFDLPLKKTNPVTENFKSVHKQTMFTYHEREKNATIFSY